jgi:hypothetical protein
MINDLTPKQQPVQETRQILPEFGIGECVIFNDGNNDIVYVSGIIIRAGGQFTYLVSERGNEVEVRGCELFKWADLPDAEEDEDE